METIAKVQRHLSLSQLSMAVFTMFMICWLSRVISSWVQHMYQSLSPRSRWYTYNYVVPSKDSFNSGESLSFATSVDRKKWMMMQWQDTAFCDDGDKFTWKMNTQYWPGNNQMEYRPEGLWESLWSYSLPILQTAEKCKMCGAVIWYTDLWYKKIRTYCTNWFLVNQ